MVRRYWSKFGHVPRHIIRYFTGRLCSAIESVPGFVYLCRDVTYRPVPVKCKFLTLLNRILVSYATKQMTHDGLM